MKILIVGQYYFPENFIINRISARLSGDGHRVTVLTGLPDYSTGRVLPEYRFFKKRRETVDGVSVIRVPIVERRSGLVRRALNYLSFAVNSSVRALFMKKDFDLVISTQTSPVFMAHAARLAARMSHAPFLLYCMDLWPECLKAWNVDESSPVFSASHRYSRAMYGGADILAVSSEPFIEYMTRVNGVDPARLTYLPQFCADRALALEKMSRQPQQGFTVFTFAGNLGSVQRVDSIVRAAALVPDDVKILINIYGSGSEEERCRELACQLGVQDRVVFHGRVDSAALNACYKNTDAFLLTLSDDSYIGLTLPAKVADYMSAAKPIIAAVGGAAARVIGDAGAGIVCSPGDGQALADAVTEFCRNRDSYSAAGERARCWYENNFTEELFFSRLYALTDRLCGR